MGVLPILPCTLLIAAVVLHKIYIMQNTNNDWNDSQEKIHRPNRPDFERYKAKRKVGLGLVVIVIGLVVLLKQLGLSIYLPIREFWPYILIIIGLIVGLKNRFRSAGPLIMIIIGIAFAIPSFQFMVGDTVVRSTKLVAPILLILIGLYFLFGKKKMHSSCAPNTSIRDENYLNSEVMFGGSKEVITSKTFNGGEVSVLFAGAEINLTQAEATNHVIYLNMQVVFGGCELLIPSHWDVKNEMFVALGSVDDKRLLRTKDANTQRTTLILKGTCVFGGVDVKSY